MYGTPTDLADWMGADAPPPLATVLLRHAEGLVLDAAAGAVYRVDSDGRATDARTATALTEATLTQAEAWAVAGLDPRKGPEQLPPRVASKSLGSKSVQYAVYAAADEERRRFASGVDLTPAALTILANAGLLTTRVGIVGVEDDRHGYGVVHIGYRDGNPVTGELGPLAAEVGPTLNP